MEQTFNNQQEENQVPDLQESDMVPGATGYVWDPVNKQWQPVFAQGE